MGLSVRCRRAGDRRSGGAAVRRRPPPEVLTGRWPTPASLALGPPRDTLPLIDEQHSRPRCRASPIWRSPRTEASFCVHDNGPPRGRTVSSEASPSHRRMAEAETAAWPLPSSSARMHRQRWASATRAHAGACRPEEQRRRPLTRRLVSRDSRRDSACWDRADPAAGKRPADCCSRWRRRSRQSPSPQQRHARADTLPLHEKGGVTRQRRSSSRATATPRSALTSASTGSFAATLQTTPPARLPLSGRSSHLVGAARDAASLAEKRKRRVGCPLYPSLGHSASARATALSDNPAIVPSSLLVQPVRGRSRLKATRTSQRQRYVLPNLPAPSTF